MSEKDVEEPCKFPEFKGFRNEKAECIHYLGEISQEQQFVEMEAFLEENEEVAMEHLKRIGKLIDGAKEIGCISEETHRGMKNCYKSMEKNYEEFFDTYGNDDRNTGNLAGDSLNMWAVTKGANEVSEFEG